jgi:hypothetical protein
MVEMAGKMPGSKWQILMRSGSDIGRSPVQVQQVNIPIPRPIHSSNHFTVAFITTNISEKPFVCREHLCRVVAASRLQTSTIRFSNTFAAEQ